jgi:hypothetical protein
MALGRDLFRCILRARSQHRRRAYAAAHGACGEAWAAILGAARRTMLYCQP